MGEEWLSESRGYYWLRAVARLADGVATQVAEEAATAAHRAGRFSAEGSSTYDAEARVVAAPLIEARAALEAARREGLGRVLRNGEAREASVAIWLTGVALIVLIIACVNVANLLLARAIRQQRETAIRVALGVSRNRLVGQTVAEGLVLAALGGIAAILVARWGGDIVRSVLLPNVEFADNGLNMRVLPFVLGLSIVAGLVAAIIPAVESTRRGTATTLRITAGGITRSANRVRATLSMAQASLSVVLLVGAGLFVRSLHNVRTMDLGFDPEGLLLATFVVDGGDLTEQEKQSFFPAAADRLSAQPGIESVAWSQGVPFYFSFSTSFDIPGRDSLPTPHSGGPYINGVNADYFRTMRLRILRGREFEPAEFASGLAVIVNQAMVDLYWPDEDPIGTCVRVGDRDENPACSTVVGIVENARRGSIIEEPNPQYYVPNSHAALSSFGEAMFIRVSDETRAMPLIHSTLLALSPRLRFVHVRPLRDLSSSETRAWTLGATMFTIFGLLALIVAAFGLYSVLAFDVAQRTREIGLRSALGAGSRRILSSVVSRAVRITALGIAAGIVIAILVAPYIEDLLFETQARDSLTLATVAIVLIATAILAAGLPAWRAARIDPNIALRSE